MLKCKNAVKRNEKKTIVCVIYYLHLHSVYVIKLYAHVTPTLTNVQIISSGLLMYIYLPLTTFLNFPQLWLSTFKLQNLSCFSYPTTRYGTLKESVCNIVWCSSKSISYKIPSFKWTFDLHKYKICHVSVTTPLDMALWENQLATSRDVAARASPSKFQVSNGLFNYKIQNLSCFCYHATQ